MSKTIFYLFLIIILSCKPEKVSSYKDNKDSIKYSVVDWQEGFGLTHSAELDSIWRNPVKFYTTNKNCDSTAIKFYLGIYQPKDEPETTRLLSLVTVENDSLRPFYRWILNKTIQIQDGALAEYTGVPARKYAEKFPEEFFEYIDYDKSGQKYINWTRSIMYSGFYKDDDKLTMGEIRENFDKEMLAHCKNCNVITKNKIKRIAKDCFPNDNFLK